MSSLEEANAAILGISADNVFANNEFAAANGIGFPLLCDVRRTAIEAYGLAIHDFGAPGFTASQRAVFVVEPDGSVGYAWVAENPGLEPDYDEVVAYCAG
jgi:peroxiredoxin